MDEDEPPDSRKCLSELLRVGEKVRSHEDFVTFAGVLPSGTSGVVSQVEEHKDGSSYYWLSFPVPGRNHPVPRYVDQDKFYDTFDLIREEELAFNAAG